MECVSALRWDGEISRRKPRSIISRNIEVYLLLTFCGAMKSNAHKAGGLFEHSPSFLLAIETADKAYHLFDIHHWKSWSLKPGVGVENYGHNDSILRCRHRILILRATLLGSRRVGSCCVSAITRIISNVHEHSLPDAAREILSSAPIMRMAYHMLMIIK